MMPFTIRVRPTSRPAGRREDKYLELMAPGNCWRSTALRVRPAAWVQPEYRGFKAPQVHKASREILGRRAYKAPRANKVFRVIRGRRVFRESRVTLGRRVFRATRATRERRVRPGQPERRAQQV